MRAMIFQVSDPVYWGFQVVVDDLLIFPHDGPEKEIVTMVKSTMKEFFSSHNLLMLADGVDALELGIHEYGETITYVCSGCKDAHGH
jgi:hypothetical protein